MKQKRFECMERKKEIGVNQLNPFIKKRRLKIDFLKKKVVDY